MKKSQLAIQLSKLKSFSKPDFNAEQYSTDSEIAATVLWHAYMRGDIQDKVVADLGAGTGILCIGAALLGAKKVYCVEQDEEAIRILKDNTPKELSKKLAIVHSDIADFNEKADTVIMNPPFGTKEKHADKSFLERALKISDTIYSFHKTSTLEFIKAFCRDNNLNLEETMNFKFPLKKTFKHHKKEREYIEVSCVVLKKI